jgi:isohexenylglutaconyl-CoA hydratase
VLRCSESDDRAVLDDAAETLVDLLRRPEAAEGMRHFMAKTRPPWARE